jgi:predicted  nucleic acid-binding Zn-ribbon protein
MDDGCRCGSKVFSFIRSVNGNATEEAGAKNDVPKEAAIPPNSSSSVSSATGAATVISTPQTASEGQASMVKEAEKLPEQLSPDMHFASAKKQDEDGKAPDSYFARNTFTSEDVENIKVLTEGVFVLNVNTLARDPLVLKDEDGIYYVKLPFEQKKKLCASAENKGEK